MQIGLWKPLFRAGNLNREFRAHYLGFSSIAAYLRSVAPQHEISIGETKGMNLIGMSCVSETHHLVKDKCRELRESGFAGPIILGGPHFTALPETMPAQADCCVVGSGEETFAELVALFEKDRHPALDAVAGIAYRDEMGVTHVTPPRECVPLDDLPVDLYACPNDWFQISTVRGCPYRCEHCVEHTNQGKVRALSAERLLWIMKERVRLTGNSDFFFQDDTFLVAEGRLERLHDIMRKKNLFGKFKIHAVSLNANLVREHTLPMLKDIGVLKLGMGAESWSARVFSHMKRRVVTQGDLVRTLGYAEKAGMLPVGGAIVVGYPGETAEELAESIHGARTMQDKGLFNVWGCYVCQPLPGSRLWQRMFSKGRVSIDMDFSTLRIDAISSHFTSDWAYWNQAEMSRGLFKETVKASGFARATQFL